MLKQDKLQLILLLRRYLNQLFSPMIRALYVTEDSMIREVSIDDLSVGRLKSELSKSKKFIAYYLFPSPRNIDEHGKPKWEYSCSIRLVNDQIEYVIEGHGIGRNLIEIKDFTELSKRIEFDNSRFNNGHKFYILTEL